MGRRSWWQRSLNMHLRSLERRIERQKERTLKYQGEAIERVSGARRRGEIVTGVDTREGKKVAHELRWGEKWNRRRAKWDARARKYACR